MLRAVVGSVGCCLLGGVATGLVRPIVLALELRETIAKNPSLNGARAVEEILRSMTQDGLLDN